MSGDEITRVVILIGGTALVSFGSYMLAGSGGMYLAIGSVALLVWHSQPPIRK